MKTENTWAIASVSPVQIDAIVRQARAERAKVMRDALVQLPALLKRLVARIRPTRPHLPQTKAWA